MSKNRFDKVWSDNDDEEEKARIEEGSSEEDEEDADTLYDMVFEAENSDLLCVNENGKTNEIQAYGTAKIALVPKPESDEMQPVLYFFDGEDDNAPLSFQEIVEKNSPYLDLVPENDRGVSFTRRNPESKEDQQVIITFPSSDACIEFMRVFETAKISPNDLSVVGQMAPIYNDENDDDSSEGSDSSDDDDDEDEDGENPFSGIKKGESLSNGPIFGNSSSDAPKASPVKSIDNEKLFESIFENSGVNIFGGSAGNIFSPRKPHDEGAENVTTPPAPTTGQGKGNIFGSPSASPVIAGGIFGHSRTSERPTPVLSEAVGEKDKGAATTTTEVAAAAAPGFAAEEKTQGEADEDNIEEEVLVIPGWTPSVNLELKETTETGEENEDELYSERCKVYRFRDGDWKERGLGNCKLQRNKTTGKIRMLLRQEKTGKIVLLHVVSGAHESLCDLVFHDDTQKIFSYMCQDYSEEKLGEMTHIAIRFKDAVIASEFKKAFDDAKVAGDAAPGSSVKVSSPKASPEKTTEQTENPESIPSSMFTNALTTSSFPIDGMNKTASDSKKDAPVALANNSLFAQAASTKSSDNPFASVAQAGGASGFPGFSSSPSPPNGGAPAGLFGTLSAAPATTSPSPGGEKATPGAEANANAEGNEDDVEAEVVNIPGWAPSITLDVKEKIETGEEDEDVLASIRAKLYRFREGEWKERGLGDVKLLQNPATKKVRCLLRQEHTGKIACNFLIGDEAPYCELQPNPGSEKAWVFTAQDFSEGEMNVEQFCARFRDVTAAGEFKKAFDAAKKGEKVTINLPAGANSPKKDTKQKEADQKPASPSKAAISEVPKTGLFGASAPTSGTSIFGTPIENASSVTGSSLFGTKKEDAAPTGGLFGTKKEDPAPTGGLFGNLKKEDEKPATGGLFGSPAPSGGLFGSPAPSSGGPFGSSFKKEDEKPVSLSKEDYSAPEAKDESASSGIFSGVFSKPPAQSSDGTTTTTDGGGLFGGNTSAVAWPGSQAPILFSSPGTKTTDKSATMLAIPSDEVRGGATKNEHDIKGDDADEEENVEEEVEVIPGWAPSITLELKDKIETGEEDEEELYSVRCKLFRFRDSEWKERGVGTMRLLRNKHRHVRFLLRQDNTGKIVANFAVVEQQGVCELTDNPGSAKALNWAALDSSEGERIMEQFCMRVKDVQQKEEFQRAFEAAKKGEAIPREAKQFSDAPNVVTTPMPAVSVSQPSGPASTTAKSGIFGAPLSTTNTNTNALLPTVPEVAAAPTEEEQEPNIEEEVFTIPGWTPSVTLNVKEKVDTGEEEEEILYCIRAKLYRFREGQWKERGLGDVKLLRNNAIHKVRFLMRQERTGKIVGNFFLTDEALYCDLQPNEGSEKAWVFSCLDYSEGEMIGEQMCIRFKDVPTKEEFKRAFDAGKKGEKIEDVTYGTQGAQASQSGGGNTSNEPTFGAKKEAPAKTTPLPATGSVFNSSSDASGLFSSTKDVSKSAMSGGLFSTAAAGASTNTTSGGLFSGAAGTPPRTTSGGLFSGAAGAPPRATMGGLFSTAATGASTGATSGGLFFSSAAGAGATTSATSGGLFDAKVAGTSGGLFGNFSGTLYGTDKDTKGAPEEEKPSVSVEPSNLDDENIEVEVVHIPGWEPSVNLEVLDAVTTGEEKEDALYCQRAKLYRFRDEEWKERGTGEARLLKNRDSSVIRFLMRQDNTNKICANFVVTDKAPYCDLLEHDNEKAWVLTAQDWSEGENITEKFLIRFKTKEIREAFKPHFEAAKKGEAYAGGIVKTRMSSMISPPSSTAITDKEGENQGCTEGFLTGANAIPLGGGGATEASTQGEGFLTGANAIPLGSRSNPNPHANSIFAGFKDRKDDEEKYNDEQHGISVDSLKRFDGTWISIYDGEPRAYIEDGIITSLYGSTAQQATELYKVTNNKVEVCWHGQDTWIGTLQPDGRLEWDDEDMWEKQDDYDNDDEDEGRSGLPILSSQAELMEKLIEKQNDPNNWKCPVCLLLWPKTLDTCGACDTARPGLDPDAVAKEKVASKNRALGAFLGSAAPSAGASASGGNSIFGGGAPFTSSTVFGAPPAASGSQTTSSNFGAPSSNATIAPKTGAPSPSSSIFGAPTTSDTTIEPKAGAPSPSSSIFGAPQSPVKKELPKVPIFGAPQVNAPQPPAAGVGTGAANSPGVFNTRSFSSSAGPPQTTTSSSSFKTVVPPSSSSSVFNVFGAGGTAAPPGHPGVAVSKMSSVCAPKAAVPPQMGAAQFGSTQCAAPQNHPVPPIQKDMVPASQIIVPSPKVPMVQPSPQMLRPLINQIVFEETQKWDLKHVQLEFLIDELSAKMEKGQGSLEREQQTHARSLDVFRKKVGEIFTMGKSNQEVNREQEVKVRQLEARFNEFTRSLNEIKTRLETESNDSLRRENQELREKMETMEANAEAMMEDKIRQLEEKLLSKGHVLEKKKFGQKQAYSTIPLGRRLFGEQRHGTYRHPMDLDTGNRDLNLLRPRDKGFAKENGGTLEGR